MTRLDVRLASRNVFRQGIRSAMPLLVVALSCFVIILVGGLYQYLFDSLEQSVIRSDGHLRIEAVGTDGNATTGFMTEGIADRIRAIEGVRVVAFRSPVSGVIGFGDQSSIFSGQAVDPAAERVLQSWPDGSPLAGDAGAAGDEKASAGYLLAEGLGLNVGDWISGIAGYGSFAAEVGDIVHTDSEENDRFFLELPYEALGGIDYGTIRSVHVQVTDPATLSRVTAGIRSVFDTAGIGGLKFTEAASSGGYIASVRTIYGDNLRFIMIVLSITVFFAIAAAFTLSITERTQELGTMRSFGARNGHLEALFQIEALYLSVYGFVFGSGLSLLTGFLVNLGGGIELPPPPTVEGSIIVGFAFNPVYLVIAFALVLAVGQLSSLIVTRRIGRLSVIEQLGLNS